MARHEVDFASAPSYDVLDVGVYEGMVEQITYKDARSKDKFPQLSVTLVVTGGKDDGRKAWQNLSFSPKAIGRMAKFFYLFGLDKDAIAAIEYDDDADPMVVTDPDLTGEPVEFKVKHREWDGEMQADVTVIKWLGGDAKPQPKKTVTKASAKVAEADEDDDTEDDDDDTEETPAVTRRVVTRAGGNDGKRKLS